MCMVYVEFTPLAPLFLLVGGMATSLLLVGGMATSLFHLPSFFRHVKHKSFYSFLSLFLEIAMLPFERYFNEEQTFAME